MATQKRQGVQIEIADRHKRRKLGFQATHFTRAEDKADFSEQQLFDRREKEERLQERREEQARLNAARVVRYEVRRPVKCIKNLLTSWMTQQESLLKQ